MATRSMIAMQTKEGQYKAIYCHWGGSISENGKTLFEHYKDTNKVEQLLELGDISMLGEQPIEDPQGWSHELPHDPTKCITYASRGDKDVQARLYEDQSELIISATNRVEYIYLWQDDRWYVQEVPLWHDLGDAIEDEE